MSLIKGLTILNRVRKEVKMKTFLKNWKTSVPALISGVVNILPFFGVMVPEPLSNAITLIAVSLIGLFARDADKSSEDTGIK